MVSFHKTKHVIRSANTNVTLGELRERADPLSYNKTGTPVYTRRQSFLFIPSYKFAREELTNTCTHTHEKKDETFY